MIGISRLFEGLFKKKITQVTSITFRGKSFEIDRQYALFVFQNPDIICTSLCQDFEKYGNTESFILIVTYKTNNKQPI